jgi:hypothetical protein
MFGITEDRAELFAWLVIDHAAVMGLARHDAALAGKIGELKRQVAGRVPEIDERFWLGR